MKKRFHFSCGNSTDGSIGFCGAVFGETEAEALAKFKAALPGEVDVEFDREVHPDVEYVEVYMNEDAVTLEDIDEVDDDVEED